MVNFSFVSLLSVCAAARSNRKTAREREPWCAALRPARTTASASSSPPSKERRHCTGVLAESACEKQARACQRARAVACTAHARAPAARTSATVVSDSAA
jgi:hypothetical protein